MVVEIDVTGGETEQIVDFLLGKDPLAAVLAAAEIAAAVLHHGGPLQRHGFGEFIGRGRFRGLRGILRIERGLPLGCNCILVDWIVARHVVTPVPSLDDDFLEQHGVDQVRRQRDIDPLGQFFLQPEQPRRAVRSPGRNSRK